MRDIPVLGTFSVGRTTQTAGTAIVQLIPPWPGPIGAAPAAFSYSRAGASWLVSPNFGVPHVTSLNVLQGSTAHTFWLAKPKNFTYFLSALAVNTTLIPNAALAGDPGVYSTNYLYPTPGGVPPGQVADNAIAAGDYVAYQLADGTWVS